MARVVVAFRFDITDIQNKYKLCQNKTPDNVAGVITGLQTLPRLQASVMTDYYQ